MMRLIKRILIIICLILFTIILMFINNKENNIKNFTYKVDNKEIYYPVFNDTNIDNYLNNYLNNQIELLDDYKLYIDYDYQEKDDNIILTFYQNAYYNKLEVNKLKSFNINLKTSEITESNSNVKIDTTNNKSNNNNQKLIAFTFDDGPNHNTIKIINSLKKYNMSATFFILGSRIKDNQNIIKLMQEAGMEIANHTYSHRLLTNASVEDITNEVKKTSELIYEVTNTYPKLVRPSYGSFNSRIRKSINMPIIIWNIDTLDWKYHNSQKITNKILNKVSDGDIILMHDIYSATANAIEIVIPKLIEKGYKIVSVSELFYYKNIKLENGKVYGNAGK